MHWAKFVDMPNISSDFSMLMDQIQERLVLTGQCLSFLAQKLNNKPLTIVGDGKQTRDFIHVSDLVEAVIKIADSKKNNEIYNLASGKETSVNYIAKIIGGETIKIPKRPGEPDRSLADILKIKKEINWEPKIKIEDGVKMMLKIIDNWKEAPV